MLRAAISRESNNSNENKIPRILNHAYADLMIQVSTQKLLKLNSYHTFCVEHSGSINVYTLKDYTNIFHVENLWAFLHGKKRPVPGLATQVYAVINKL